MRYLKLALLVLLALLLPVAVFAQGAPATDLHGVLVQIVTFLVPIAAGYVTTAFTKVLGFLDSLGTVGSYLAFAVATFLVNLGLGAAGLPLVADIHGIGGEAILSILQAVATLLLHRSNVAAIRSGAHARALKPRG